MYRKSKGGSGLRGEGGLDLAISDEGGIVVIGSDSFGEIAFGAGRENAWSLQKAQRTR